MFSLEGMRVFGLRPNDQMGLRRIVRLMPETSNVAFYASCVKW